MIGDNYKVFTLLHSFPLMQKNVGLKRLKSNNLTFMIFNYSNVNTLLCSQKMENIYLIKIEQFNSN